MTTFPPPFLFPNVVISYSVSLNPFREPRFSIPRIQAQSSSSSSTKSLAKAKASFEAPFPPDLSERKKKI